MLINLKESKLFTVNPAERFAVIYKVPRRTWHELWRRYCIGYDLEGLCGYLLYTKNIHLDLRTMRRWLFRAEVYFKAETVMKMGVRCVQSEYFGTIEDDVIEELLKSMKAGKAQNSRAVV